MSRREKQPGHAAQPPGVTTRQKTRRAGDGDANDSESLQGARDEVRSLSLDSSGGDATPVSGRSNHNMGYDSARAMTHPYRVPGRPVYERDAPRMRGRQQIDPDMEAELDDPELFYPGSYSRSIGGNRPTEGRSPYHEGLALEQERRYQSPRLSTDRNAYSAQGRPQQDVGSKQDQENTDTSRDPSTDNGESSVNSLEAQQWSDTEGNNRPPSAHTADPSADARGEVPCRVSWCEQVGKRYGLCWAHGGVKKCCHRNCPKIALATSEFCSIHEREVSANTF